MRIFNQLLIFGLFIFVLLLIRSDYKNIYSNTLNYLENQVKETSSLYKDKIDEVRNSIDNNINTNINNTEVETPGALVVPDDFLASNIKNIKLTSKEIITITNNYRKDNGNISPLEENSKLNFSAEKKLQDMFVKQYFEHVSPSGVGVGDLGNQVSYEYIIIGENLAFGNFKDNKSLVDAWMASPGHRANILNKKYGEIGVAVGQGTYKGKSVWMAVQHFGLPKSVCPKIDDVLKGIIDLEQKQIKDLESDLLNRKSRIESGAIYDGMTTGDQIGKYNNLVSDYNNLVLTIKNRIDKYNEQVRSFNNCIAVFSE